MKLKHIALSLSLLACTTAGAQKHRLEHNFYISEGIAKPYNSTETLPLSLRFGYGLNCYLSDRWSVMPGIAYRGKIRWTDALLGMGAYNFACIDVPLLAQYHFGDPQKSGFVAELGSVLSFLTTNSEHYWWEKERKGEKIYKSFDMGLQPGVYYQVGKHWRFGVQGRIGLLNIVKQYPNRPSESYHAHDITATVNFHF